MSLAERRHHEQRIKKKLERKEKKHPYWTSDGKTDERSKGLYANHGCNCSCWMCGNPRRHFGKETVQEMKSKIEWHGKSVKLTQAEMKKAYEQALEELEELGEKLDELRR